MAVPAKIFAFAGLILLVATPALAEDAKPVAPGERCEGTLCDLYYGSRGSAPATTSAQPATSAPTPVVAPSGGLMNMFGRSNGPANAQPAEPPSASNSYMSMGGGGLLGGRQERCEGTICDVYYGSSSKAGADGTAAAPAAQRQAFAEPPVVRRHIPHESEFRPKCSSPNADPWRCYR